MNLYLVVSEQLTEMVWEDWFVNAGHEETYCIAELVIASKPSQAKWLAWKSDKNTFTGRPTEIPKMSCRVHSVAIPNMNPCIVTHDPKYQFAWSFWEPDDANL